MTSFLSTLGKVYLVGVGPGATDLITVRGTTLLAQADVVFHDALTEKEMLAYCQQAKKLQLVSAVANIQQRKNLSISV